MESDQRPKIGLDSACATLARLRTGRRLVAVYRLPDALADSMFPFLSAMDDRIEDLQDQIVAGPREPQLAALFEAKATGTCSAARSTRTCR